MILIVVMYSFFAAAFTIAKILLKFLPPVWLIGIRMSISGVVLLAMYAYVEKRLPKMSLRSIPWWLFFAAVHIMIPYVTEFIALEVIAPSCSALVYNLGPFFAAFFSYIYFREKMTLKKWLGLFIGSVGISWFIQSEVIICDAYTTAYLLLLISGIFGSLGWIYVRKLVLSGYAPLFINGVAMLLGGFQALAIAYFYETNVTFNWDTLPQFAGWLALIILITNIVFYNLYSYLLKSYTATLLSFAGCVVPLFTALFDWFLLGISISPTFLVSFLIASFGVYLFYQEELRQGYIKN